MSARVTALMMFATGILASCTSFRRLPASLPVAAAELFFVRWKFPSRFVAAEKAVLGLLGCVAFMAIALLMDHSLLAYVGIVFFGLGAIMFAMQLLPSSSYLRLTREGFTMCSLFRCHTIEWRHVGRFGVGRIYTKKVVGWNPAHEISKPGKVTKAFSGFVSVLPDTYGLRAEELADLMNRLRDECAPQSI